MKYGITAWLNISIITISVALVSCGGAKSKSAGAKFKVNPTKPIVINADATVGVDKKITGPWFGFTVSMTNNTTDKITIVALEVEIYGQGPNGTQDKKTVAFTPGDSNTQTDTITCTYVTFGTWAPGETKPLALPGNQDCNKDGVFFYADNNVSGPNENNFRYRVKVKPAGWFGTMDNATDRFQTDFTFYTQ